MDQIINNLSDADASMNWDDFVQLMVEAGFTYDPSTAGNSVRFDPPNHNDPPITFHKPHPDPTLEPRLANEFARKLQRRYLRNQAPVLPQSQSPGLHPAQVPAQGYLRRSSTPNRLGDQLIRALTDANSLLEWDDFVQLMVEAGFTYDSSVAGSSVKFNPPNHNDPPITFHQPHPDPTLGPRLANQFAEKLQRRYGWDAANPNATLV